MKFDVFVFETRRPLNRCTVDCKRPNGAPLPVRGLLRLRGPQAPDGQAAVQPEAAGAAVLRGRDEGLVLRPAAVRPAAVGAEIALVPPWKPR